MKTGVAQHESLGIRGGSNGGRSCWEFLCTANFGGAGGLCRAVVRYEALFLFVGWGVSGAPSTATPTSRRVELPQTQLHYYP